MKFMWSLLGHVFNREAAEAKRSSHGWRPLMAAPESARAQVAISRARVGQVHVQWFEIHRGLTESGMAAGYRTGYCLSP